MRGKNTIGNRDIPESLLEGVQHGKRVLAAGQRHKDPVTGAYQGVLIDRPAYRLSNRRNVFIIAAWRHWSFL
jgi:hypothetical protein